MKQIFLSFKACLQSQNELQEIPKVGLIVKKIEFGAHLILQQTKLKC